MLYFTPSCPQNDKKDAAFGRHLFFVGKNSQLIPLPKASISRYNMYMWIYDHFSGWLITASLDWALCRLSLFL